MPERKKGKTLGETLKERVSEAVEGEVESLRYRASPRRFKRIISMATYAVTPGAIEDATLYFLGAVLTTGAFYLIESVLMSHNMGGVAYFLDLGYTVAHVCMLAGVLGFAYYAAAQLLDALYIWYYARGFSVNLLVRSLLYWGFGYLFSPLLIFPLVSWAAASAYWSLASVMFGLVSWWGVVPAVAAGGGVLILIAALLAVLWVFAVLVLVGAVLASATCMFVAASEYEILTSVRMRPVLVGLVARIAFSPPLALIGLGGLTRAVATLALSVYTIYAGIQAALNENYRALHDVPGLMLVWAMAQGYLPVFTTTVVNSVADAYAQAFYNLPGASLAAWLIKTLASLF